MKQPACLYNTPDDFWHAVETDAYRLLLLRANQLDNALTVTDPSGGGGRLADRATLEQMAAQVADRLRSDDDETGRRAAMIAGLAADELGRTPSRFYGSALGRACLLATPANELDGLGMSAAQAGALLNMTRQGAEHYMRLGQLKRVPDSDANIVDSRSVQTMLAERLTRVIVI